MTFNGWKAADSDMHIMEPADLWERYIAPEWRHAAPIGLSELHRDMRVRVKGTVLTASRRCGPTSTSPSGGSPTRTPRTQRQRRATVLYRKDTHEAPA